MSDYSSRDEQFMRRALELAKEAENLGEVPVGAVLVLNNEIIGEGFNSPIKGIDPTAHAEINAIRQAALHLNNYRLPDSTLYVTLEPCAMCAGAIVHSRVNRLIFAATDEKTGACGSVYDVLTTNEKTHRVICDSGLYQAEASSLISEFFKRRRAEKKAIKN